MPDPRKTSWPAAVAFALALGSAVIAARMPPRALPHTLRHAPSGAAIFRQRCITCHSVRDESGQGPGLGGVVGRKAATGRGFGYSRALRQSTLVWDRETLDRFLLAPGALVSGTTMPVAVPDADERQAILAFLSTLPAGGAPPSTSARAAAAAPLPSVPPPPAFALPHAPGDYRSDVPGVVHRVTVSDLPAPYANPSARNGPVVVEAPPGARLQVPPDFTVQLFASELLGPRRLSVAPNGDIFVAETGADQIRVLRAPDGAGSPEEVEVFASSLDGPFGIAFFPATFPQWVYVANRNSVVRFSYHPGDLRARDAPEIVVPELAPQTGGHTTRDIAFSLDQKQMFVSVGSGSNVAEDMPPRPPSPPPFPQSSGPSPESGRGAPALGASWGDETDRADVLTFDPEGDDRHVFATGLRNCVGLAVNPHTGDLWCSTNERDGLGDDLVPDYVTRVRAGAFYGWPWYYLGAQEDPRHAGERPDLGAAVTVPDVLLQAHAAPLTMTFYDGAMFPPAYRGSAFVALHGSWNRSIRTGPKVVRVFVREGVPGGDYEDFLTGFVVDGATVWGRPVGVAVAHDGALLVSEDGNGTIWRIARASR